MTGPVPGLRDLMRSGVRRSVATEYRRLLDAGVNRETAAVLARGKSRPEPEPVDLSAHDVEFLTAVSRKANCYRWHGTDCGCWQLSPPGDGPGDDPNG